MIISLAFIFLFFNVLFIYSLVKHNPKSEIKNELKKISIIIAAKNEEENIPKIITSLTNQNYPKDKYEVIIIDDNSTDNTFKLTEKIIKDFANFNIHKVTEKKYAGKRGALQFGIETAQYPNILITDADCEPNPNWIEEFALKFEEGFDFIFGVAPYRQNKSLVNKIACYTNLRTHILTFSFTNIGLPYSAAARSFGFQKKSFLKIKGYKNTTETLSGDDDLLLREAVNNNLKIGIVTEPNAFVFTEAKKTFSEYLKQKARHTSTSNYYSFKIKFLLGLWHTLNLFFLISPLLMFVNISFGIFFLLKLFTDFITAKLLMNKFGYHFNITEIIYLQMTYELMLIVNYLKGTFGKEEW